MCTVGVDENAQHVTSAMSTAGTSSLPIVSCGLFVPWVVAAALALPYGTCHAMPLVLASDLCGGGVKWWTVLGCP